MSARLAEIVRGRIRLAQGMSPEAGSPTKNVVAVIPAACDDCPIQDYFVTDICRFCLGKACLNSCRFGAISPGDAKMRMTLRASAGSTNPSASIAATAFTTVPSGPSVPRSMPSM